MAGIDISSVEDTNNDATACKRYATQLGYWEDGFLKYFCKEAQKRPPEINRGYFARHIGMQKCVDTFLAKTIGQSPQIVCLGAGFETLFWRLASCHDDHSMPVVFEVDLPGVTSQKCFSVKTKKSLNSLVEKFGKVEISQELHSPKLHISSCDIENIAELELKLVGSGLSRDKPTLFLCECVLVYIPSISVQELVTWISQTFLTVQLVSYGPVNLSDGFGEVMRHNLKRTGCDLLGADLCNTLDTQLGLMNAFQRKTVILMDSVYKGVNEKERKRIEKLEFLDEIEPFFQLLVHYSIAIGVNDSMGLGITPELWN